MSSTLTERGEPTVTVDKIHISPEMMAAGIDAYCLFSSEDPGEWRVEAVYRAMATVRSDQERDQTHQF